MWQRWIGVGSQVQCAKFEGGILTPTLQKPPFVMPHKSLPTARRSRGA
jgi:hypothetical protein